MVLGLLLMCLMVVVGGIVNVCVLYEVCFFLECFLKGIGFLDVIVLELVMELLVVDVCVFLIDDVIIMEIDDVIFVILIDDVIVCIGIYIVVLGFGI